MKDLKPYINAYISNWDYINNLEDYKWEAIKHFQNTFHVEGSITSRTIQGLSKHVNLLDSQTYYPLGMLIEVSKEKQDVTDKLLTNLFDETIPLTVLSGYSCRLCLFGSALPKGSLYIQVQHIPDICKHGGV